MIRILTDFPEKQNTRLLYEQAFSDPEAFVAYYYREKCADNKMVVLEEDGKILSMVHLNPYTVSICGKEAPSYYLVAVATDKDHRRKGYMAQVLEAAFAEMEREKVPFCFLLPVDEAIYRPFGFHTVCDFVTRENPLSGLPYEEVQARYDVYCVQDALYNRRRETEDRLAEEDASEVLPERPVIMVKELTAFPSSAKDLRFYFREEV